MPMSQRPVPSALALKRLGQEERFVWKFQLPF